MADQLTQMNFTPDQQKAIQTTSRNALVLAGAGSGKTSVITERVFHLLGQNISPQEILVITFTRKAAGEMKQRIEEKIGSQVASEMFVGTFHSWCLDYLTRYRGILTILSQKEEEILIKQVAQDLGYYNGKKWKIPRKDIDQIFFHFYNFGWRAEDLAGDGLLIFQEFMRRCEESRIVTYGMILTEFDKYKSEIPFYYKHILIDEVQDMNETQWQIIYDYRRTASLFCVGDIDQSIYEWRGANPGHLLIDSNEFDIFYIGYNFRSGEKIVHAANSLIAKNQQRFDKTMRPFRNGGRIWTHLLDMDSEELADLLINNHYPKPVCVVARTHFLLTKLSKVLDGYPHCYVGHDVMETKEWLTIHAYMKLFVNPYDNFSFMILADELIGDKHGYATIRENAILNQQSHFQEWLDSEYRKESIFDLACGSDIMLDNLLIYMKEYFVSTRQPAYESVVNMLLMKYAIPMGRVTLYEYIRYISLWEPQDEINDSRQSDLYLMTLHACKGLEFPTVIIAGLNEGIFPLKNGNIEEERRLLYVGMTRAKELLVLTARPENTETPEGRIYQNPISRFMNEITV